MTSGLLKVLSEFMVYGPKLRPYDPSDPKPIHPPIVLEEITLEFVHQNPDSRFPSLEPSSMARRGWKTSEERSVFDMAMIVARLTASGQLYGRVKEVRMVVESTEKTWDVREMSKGDILKTAETWADYGWQSMASVIRGEL